MRPAILAEPPRGRFTFVVGKGGVGKSTTAAAIALNWAANGRKVHLISTDPAPSITDIFRITPGPYPRTSACNDRLTLEELDADAVTEHWMDRVRAPLEQLVEQGTYLDGNDVSRLTHLTLPGIDELGAALRIAELSEQDAHIVVDTAPTGHTLRLLDAAHLIDSWADVFFAMADKVATIAFTMVNARIRLTGEDAVEEMRRTASAFRAALDRADFVVVTRRGDVVAAETTRLIAALRERKLQIAAVVMVETESKEGIDADAPAQDPPTQNPPAMDSGDVRMEMIFVPRLGDASGCDGLRAWADAASVVTGAIAQSAPVAVVRRVDDVVTQSAREWLQSRRQRLFWFAGKGGVGKSTCAAAAALAWSEDRNVLLCSTDPAGSLREVLQTTSDDVSLNPRLRALQIDAAGQLDEWRSKYRAEADAVFDQLGVGGSATLDRNIMRAIWDAVPPGIDELFSLGEILDAAETTDTIVIDAAPTGHFVRLLESPELALEWTHAILRILLKYGVAGAVEGFSERILAFAKQLKHLRAVMTDPVSCGVFVVTIDEPVVQAQTKRLIEDLGRIQIPVVATILNRVDASMIVPVIGVTGIIAPLRNEPPAGVQNLEAFVDLWRLA